MSNLKRLREDKKGNIQGILTVIVVLLIFGIFIGFMAYLIPEITDNLRHSELNETEETRGALQEADDTVGMLDYLFLLVFSGLIMVILGTSFFIRSHPIFIPIFIFFMAFGLIVSVIAERIYIEFSENAILSSTMATQTYTQAILDKFPLIMIGVGFLAMVIIFARGGGGEGRI